MDDSVLYNIYADLANEEDFRGKFEEHESYEKRIEKEIKRMNDSKMFAADEKNYQEDIKNTLSKLPEIYRYNFLEQTSKKRKLVMKKEKSEEQIKEALLNETKADRIKQTNINTQEETNPINTVNFDTLIKWLEIVRNDSIPFVSYCILKDKDTLLLSSGETWNSDINRLRRLKRYPIANAEDKFIEEFVSAQIYETYDFGSIYLISQLPSDTEEEKIIKRDIIKKKPKLFDVSGLSIFERFVKWKEINATNDLNNAKLSERINVPKQFYNLMEKRGFLITNFIGSRRPTKIWGIELQTNLTIPNPKTPEIPFYKLPADLKVNAVIRTIKIYTKEDLFKIHPDLVYLKTWIELKEDVFIKTLYERSKYTDYLYDILNCVKFSTPAISDEHNEEEWIDLI